MTYASFLLWFLVIPILILGVMAYYERRRRNAFGRNVPTYGVLLLILVLIAVVYTTPWDNHLVASGVWTYDRTLVWGITLGWVPLEEYLFFILQPLLTGLFLLLVARRIRISVPFRVNNDSRVLSLSIVGILWIMSMAILLSGWKSGTYLSLELTWALLPIGLQIAVGADILWHYRRIVLPGILLPTLYLCIADLLAIGSGTWTISPEYSLGILVGGILPVEEILFFLVTNTLLVFGLTLGAANESVSRVASAVKRWTFGKRWRSTGRILE